MRPVQAPATSSCAAKLSTATGTSTVEHPASAGCAASASTPERLQGASTAVRAPATSAGYAASGGVTGRLFSSLGAPD